MYRVEARISNLELVKEHYYSLRKALPTVYSELFSFINGVGRIERWTDIETLEEVMAGIRQDEFPWEIWPLKEGNDG